MKSIFSSDTETTGSDDVDEKVYNKIKLVSQIRLVVFFYQIQVFIGVSSNGIPYWKDLKFALGSLFSMNFFQVNYLIHEKVELRNK